MPKRKIGLGTLSLMLSITAIAWSFSFQSFCIGDSILDFLGLQAWSNGNNGIHYAVFYALIFLMPAFLLSRKYEGDLGSKIGGFLSVFIGVFLFLSLLGLSF